MNFRKMRNVVIKNIYQMKEVKGVREARVMKLTKVIMKNRTIRYMSMYA
jgi:hypothetical protein